MEVCKWENKNACIILNNLISSKVREQTDSKTTIAARLKTLVSIKYPPEDACLYIETLQFIKQENYVFVAEYLQDITNFAKKLTSCQEGRKTDINTRIEETFIVNLHGKVKLEMRKLGRTTFRDIFDTIEAAERLIVNLQNANDTCTEGSNIKQFKTNTNSHHRQMYRPQGPKKYCKFQKIFSHDSKECRVLQNNKPNFPQHSSWSLAKHDGNNRRQSYGQEKPNIGFSEKKTPDQPSTNQDDSHTLVIQPMPDPDSLILTTKISNENLLLTVDTGSKYIFISKELSEELKLQTELVSALYVTFGNRSTEQITTATKVILSIIGENQQNLVVNFYIANNLPCKAILGIQFLRMNNSVIDFIDGTFKLNDQYVSTNFSAIYSHPDNIIANNTDIMFISTQISNFITKNKLENPPLGKISNIECKIELKTDGCVNKSAYNILLKLRGKIQNHIAKLLKDEIIRKSSSNFSRSTYAIPKPNGDVRLVTDFRELNKMTKDVYYPFPSTTDVLQH